jgi:hypothetical protein
VKAATKPKNPDLFPPIADYPHGGYRSHRGDPRLREYLAYLAEVLAEDDDDLLLRALCAGIWWVPRSDAERLAAELRRLLEG